jgi:hypothetical protein
MRYSLAAKLSYQLRTITNIDSRTLSLTEAARNFQRYTQGGAALPKIPRPDSSARITKPSAVATASFNKITLSRKIMIHKTA